MSKIRINQSFFMATPGTDGQATRGNRRAGATRRIALWLLLGLWTTLAVPGCGGCGKDKATIDREAKRKQLEEEEKKKKEKEKPKPDFAAGRSLMTQPNGLSLVETAFKPGHWTSASLEMTANNFHFRGELQTDPFELAGMPFRLGTSRPANLPKAEAKNLELIYYVPPGKKRNKVVVRLLAPGGRREVLQEPYPTVPIPDHQFYFLVLANTPSRYRYLRSLNTVSPFVGWSPASPQHNYYRVLMPKIEKRVPLPSNSLCWTGVAYVLWDEFDPTLLLPDQQQAMLDWLHWGGRLVISGPDSLDALRTSFLSAYLPALGGETLELDAAALAPISNAWSREAAPLAPEKKWSGRKLLVNPEDRDVQILHESPAGEPLLVERRLGRGGIVLSAFGLSHRDLVAWRGLDEFVHSCLLRREPREFMFQEDRGHFTRWDGRAGSMFDAAHVSDLNYFTRDDFVTRDSEFWRAIMSGGAPKKSWVDSTAKREVFDPNAPETDLSIAGMYGVAEDSQNYGPGVAGWSDFNLPAEVARGTLREAAGIAIPEAGFVVWVLGLYLLVLVPLNWAVFRVLGRVELAWVAAPLITIGFALAVVKLAQLDIGFVRAKTELAVVEFNGGHPKAHITRYTALYTSLATRYDFQFDDATALMQPFPPKSKDDQTNLLQGQLYSTVNFRRSPSGDSDSGTHITLEGFEVSSNSLGMLHSEHMADMGGIVLQGNRAAGYTVVNKTSLALRGASVVGKDEAGKDEVAWIGDLPAGGQAALTFESGDIEALWTEERAAAWQRRAEDDRHKPIEIRKLARLAQFRNLAGELRLVAWTDEEVAGMSIEPAASQSQQAALIVAHLSYGPRLRPQPDKTSFAQARAQADDYDRRMNLDLRTVVPGIQDMLNEDPEGEGPEGENSTEADGS